MELEPPYIAFASFCERVLQEQDGVLSAIRIVDRLIIQAPPPEAGDNSPTPVQISMLIGLRSGGYVGSGLLSVRGVLPSGKEFQTKTEAIAELKGADTGFNVIINAFMPIKERGIYWFDVVFNNRLLTRIPLSVLAQSELTSATEAKPPPTKSARRSRRKS